MARARGHHLCRLYPWLPGRHQESILRDIEIIKKELPVDILEFFFLTPLPGSEDHKKMLEAGVWMDADLNKYNLNNRVTHHPKMSDAEWEEAYHAAWESWFDPAHLETVLRRHAARKPNNRKKLVRILRFWSEFHLLFMAEGVHPLEGGMFRMKDRLDRRPGMPIENPLLWYPELAGENLRKLWVYGSLFYRNWRIYRRVLNDPARAGIMWIWRSLRQRMTNSSSSPSIPARSAAPWRSTRCIATMSARRGSARRATRLPSADESHGAADLLGAPALHRPWGGAERRDIGAFAGAQANHAPAARTSTAPRATNTLKLSPSSPERSAFRGCR